MKNRVLLVLIRILLIFSIAVNITFCQEDDDSSKTRCIPDPRFKNLTSDDLQAIVEDNHLVFDKFKLNAFPNISNWMWFAPFREIENDTNDHLAFPLKVQKYGLQKLENYTIEFEAEDCDWLESIFMMEIYCACTLPSYFRYFFRMRFQVSYALPFQEFGTYYFVVSSERVEALKPLFLPEEKEFMLKTSKKLQDDAIVEYKSFPGTKKCVMFDYTANPFIYVPLSPSDLDNLLRYEQFDQNPFVIDKNHRKEITHIFFVFRTSACENTTLLRLFEIDEYCNSKVTLEKHPKMKNTMFGKLPSIEEYNTTCNCSTNNKYENRFWRMCLYLATHNYLCRANFGFLNADGQVYGNLGVELVRFEPEENTDLYYDYVTDTMLHKANGNLVTDSNSVSVIVTDDSEENDDSATTSATAETNKWHMTVFMFLHFIFLFFQKSV